MRASHADREHVIGRLKIAFVDGRLDKDELDHRVAQALAARTYAELATVTADLPAGQVLTPSPPVGVPRVRKRTVQRGLVAAGALVPPALFVIAAFNSALAPLALLALPLLYVEVVVVLVFAAVILAGQRKDRSRPNHGQLAPSPVPTDREPRPDQPDRGQPGAPVSRGPRLAPGAA
jgi:hypothetical protein